MKVTIDYPKCKFEEGCSKCLLYCPSSVFYRVADKPRTTQGLPKFYILPAAEAFCTGCMECENFCPGKAIYVKI